MYARLQNHQFLGPAFHWTHCQINNFQAQIFCVPGHKIINFWALLFFVPGCKISNFQATDFIELGAQLAISCLPSCKINIFPMQFFCARLQNPQFLQPPHFIALAPKSIISGPGFFSWPVLRCFHFYFVSLVHFITPLPLFDPCLDCTYPFTYAFHLLSLRLCTSPNHHA